MTFDKRLTRKQRTESKRMIDLLACHLPRRVKLRYMKNGVTSSPGSFSRIQKMFYD